MTKRKTQPPPPPPPEAFQPGPPTEPEEPTEVERELNARMAAWVAERKAKGQALMQRARRTYAAVEGWGRIESEADWLALQQQTAEDWYAGAGLLRMLGGARYLEPERAALCLHLWRDFIDRYQPDGPAEYLVLAMAVLSFDHYLRVNSLVHNLEARLEDEFFSLRPLQTYGDTATYTVTVRGLRVEEIAARLGNEALPWLDRLNRQVLRNLKAMRELRGPALPLTVANYGQLNVGQTQTNQTGAMSTPDRTPRQRGGGRSKATTSGAGEER